MIFGRSWIKKHKVLLDMINTSITFFPGYYTHLGASLFLILLKSKGTKSISETKHEDMISNYISKKGSNESFDNFLGKTQKLLNKKRRFINTSK